MGCGPVRLHRFSRLAWSSPSESRVSTGRSEGAQTRSDNHLETENKMKEQLLTTTIRMIEFTANKLFDVSALLEGVALRLRAIRHERNNQQ